MKLRVKIMGCRKKWVFLIGSL